GIALKPTDTPVKSLRVVTDKSGYAAVYWTLGPAAGKQVLSISHSQIANQATVSANAELPRPSSVRVVSGDKQSGFANRLLTKPLVAQVLDQGGQPLSGVAVQWKAGWGTLTPTSSTSRAGDGYV